MTCSKSPKMTTFNYDLFKVTKMTNFNYDLFKVTKMTNFNYDLFKVLFYNFILVPKRVYRIISFP